MYINKRIAVLGGLALAAAACKVVPVEQTGPAGWSHAYLVMPAPGAPAGLYVWITNPSARADTISAVRVSDADSARMHRTTSMGSGMEGMAPVDLLPVAAHDTVRFAPGGLHIMVFGLSPALRPGDSTAVTVTFRSAGDVSGYAQVITYAQVDSLIMR